MPLRGPSTACLCFVAFLLLLALVYYIRVRRASRGKAARAAAGVTVEPLLYQPPQLVAEAPVATARQPAPSWRTTGLASFPVRPVVVAPLLAATSPDRLPPAAAAASDPLWPPDSVTVTNDQVPALRDALLQHQPYGAVHTPARRANRAFSWVNVNASRRWEVWDVLLRFHGSVDSLARLASPQMPASLAAGAGGVRLSAMSSRQPVVAISDASDTSGDLIHTDAVRCKFLAYRQPPLVDSLEAVLRRWAAAHPHYEYLQALNSVAAVVLAAVGNDQAVARPAFARVADSCLSGLLSRGALNKLAEVRRVSQYLQVLTFVDPALAVHLAHIHLDPELYAIPWLTTLFVDVVEALPAALSMLDCCLALDGRLPLFMAACVMMQHRTQLMACNSLAEGLVVAAQLRDLTATVFEAALARAVRLWLWVPFGVGAIDTAPPPAVAAALTPALEPSGGPLASPRTPPPPPSTLVGDVPATPPPMSGAPSAVTPARALSSPAHVVCVLGGLVSGSEASFEGGEVADPAAATHEVRMGEWLPVVVLPHLADAPDTVVVDARRCTRHDHDRFRAHVRATLPQAAVVHCSAACIGLPPPQLPTADVAGQDRSSVAVTIDATGGIDVAAMHRAVGSPAGTAAIQASIASSLRGRRFAAFANFKPNAAAAPTSRGHGSSNRGSSCSDALLAHVWRRCPAMRRATPPRVCALFSDSVEDLALLRDVLVQAGYVGVCGLSNVGLPAAAFAHTNRAAARP